MKKQTSHEEKDKHLEIDKQKGQSQTDVKNGKTEMNKQTDKNE